MTTPREVPQRTKKSSSITIRLTDAQRAWLRLYEEEYGLPPSDAIRFLLDEYTFVQTDEGAVIVVTFAEADNVC